MSISQNIILPYRHIIVRQSLRFDDHLGFPKTVIASTAKIEAHLNVTLQI